jgi:hypothetical protein
MLSPVSPFLNGLAHRGQRVFSENSGLSRAEAAKLLLKQAFYWKEKVTVYLSPSDGSAATERALKGAGLNRPIQHGGGFEKTYILSQQTGCPAVQPLGFSKMLGDIPGGVSDTIGPIEAGQFTINAIFGEKITLVMAQPYGAKQTKFIIGPRPILEQINNSVKGFRLPIIGVSAGECAKWLANRPIDAPKQETLEVALKDKQQEDPTLTKANFSVAASPANLEGLGLNVGVTPIQENNFKWYMVVHPAIHLIPKITPWAGWNFKSPIDLGNNIFVILPKG